MIKLFRVTILLTFILLIASCGMLTGDKFVYIGHGESTPDYQLYYDIDKKLFIIVDKKNGCFKKDGTGTCLAFTLKQAKKFRINVLNKMIAIDGRIKGIKRNDIAAHKYALHEFEKAGITTVIKQIKTDKTYAKPLKQIFIDKQEQYHILSRNYLLKSSMVSVVTEGVNHQKEFNIVFVVSVPGIATRFHTELRPLVIDAKYLADHMTMDSVHTAQSMQLEVLQNHAKVQHDVKLYINKVLTGVENNKNTWHRSNSEINADESSKSPVMKAAIKAAIKAPSDDDVNRAEDSQINASSSSEAKEHVVNVAIKEPSKGDVDKAEDSQINTSSSS